MRQFAQQFYQSRAWKLTRDAYKSRAGGLCEVCWEQGIIKPGEIVHHKIPLTPENIDDQNITLNPDNLQLVCRECHAKVHGDLYEGRRKRRYKLDELGRVIF